MQTRSTFTVRIALFILLTTVVACSNTLTAPGPVAGQRATRDTTLYLADTLNCRSGYTIINGRVVCSEQ